jgi:Chromo (CHRromatin Organisation MOdifier) domain
VEVTP